MSRAAIFEAVRDARGKGFTQDEVSILDVVLDRLNVPYDPSEVMAPSQKAIDLMHRFEGCKLDAYPDPGSGDGNPWTIGYGATGPGIAKGVRWTQQQADDRFKQDLAKFAQGVARLLEGSTTSQNEFDALTSFAYNVGLGALGDSTLLRMHKAGDKAGAAAQFSRWNKNNGKPMNGLTRRRAAEAALYQGQG